MKIIGRILNTKDGDRFVGIAANGHTIDMLMLMTIENKVGKYIVVFEDPRKNCQESLKLLVMSFKRSENILICEEVSDPLEMAYVKVHIDKVIDDIVDEIEAGGE